MSISAIIIAKDAGHIVDKALKSVAFADEILLIDLNSQDETAKIAAENRATVVNYSKEAPFVELVRNFALSKAKCDWLVVLDADEELPKTLQDKLKEIAANPPDKKEAFYIPRRNIVCNSAMQHTGWWPDYQLRFFKKGSVSWSEKIHSQALVYGKEIKEQQKLIAFLEAKDELAIVHHNYDSFTDYIARLNRYTDIEASQSQIDEEFLIGQTDLLLAFKDEWFRRFFDKQGYRDGVRGFYLSLMQAMYQMTTKVKAWGRLGYQDKYQQDDQKKLLLALRGFEKELHYWIDDMSMEISSSWWQRLLIKLKRKLHL